MMVSAIDFCFAVGPEPPPFDLYDATAPAIALDAFSDLPCFLILLTKVLYDSLRGKDDFNLLEDPAFLPLQNYISARGHVDANDPMFTSESSNGKGQRLETKTVSSIIREGLNAIGLTGEEYTAHSLRNTCGSLLIKQGASLPRVQQVMRHKNMATTQGYVHDAEEKKRIDEAPESLLNNLF